MEKYLRITMADGSKWDIPASIIATDRAKFYAKHDTGLTEGPEYDKEYQAEYEFTMSDHYELIDWASNNMDWENVVDAALLAIPAPEPDFDDGWINGSKEIIEK